MSGFAAGAQRVTIREFTRKVLANYDKKKTTSFAAYPQLPAPAQRLLRQRVRAWVGAQVNSRTHVQVPIK
jgi:hypothetical protein